MKWKSIHINSRIHYVRMVAFFKINFSRNSLQQDLVDSSNL